MDSLSILSPSNVLILVCRACIRNFHSKLLVPPAGPIIRCAVALCERHEVVLPEPFKGWGFDDWVWNVCSPSVAKVQYWWRNNVLQRLLQLIQCPHFKATRSCIITMSETPVLTPYGEKKISYFKVSVMLPLSIASSHCRLWVEWTNTSLQKAMKSAAKQAE